MTNPNQSDGLLPVDRLKLAAQIEACVEDAIRPFPHPAYPGGAFEQLPDARVVCLANGLKAIVAALRHFPT